MVIGHGMMAHAFDSYRNNPEVIIFASGVSDSTKCVPGDFDREKRLLLQTMMDFPDKKLIYFSTCMIYDLGLAKSPYVIHKKAMEALVQQLSKLWNIYRLPTVAGPVSNDHTLLNRLYNSIKTGRNFEIQREAYRNVIDIQRVFEEVDSRIRFKMNTSCIMTIVSPYNISVMRIAYMLETNLKKRGNFTFTDSGTSLKEIPYSERVISLAPFYDSVESILLKYYHD